MIASVPGHCILVPFLFVPVFRSTYKFQFSNCSIFFHGARCQYYSVSDEDSLAETAQSDQSSLL